jgi:hypothetical protein
MKLAKRSGITNMILKGLLVADFAAWESVSSQAFLRATS